MINIDNLDFKETKAGDWTVYEYETIDSTNEQIKRLLIKGQRKKLIVVSYEQTSGKGRIDRKWISPYKCGLYASWLFFNNSNDTKILSLFVGLECVKYLRIWTGAEIFLKWPNDLIAHGKKLGGILIERVNDVIVIGIGINLIQSEAHPPNAISINNLTNGLKCEYKELKNNLLINLTNALGSVPSFLRNNKDFVLTDICEYLTTPPGSAVNFVKDSEIYSAKVVGLSQEGGLIVEMKDGKQEVLISEQVSVRT